MCVCVHVHMCVCVCDWGGEGQNPELLKYIIKQV